MLTKQVSARFLDARAQQFTVRPTSRARFLDENCDQLIDIQTWLWRPPEHGDHRPLSTFGLRWPVTALPVASAMSVSLSRFSSRNQLARSEHYQGVSRNSALTYTFFMQRLTATSSAECSLNRPPSRSLFTGHLFSFAIPV